jgi:hypothetical protein
MDIQGVVGIAAVCGFVITAGGLVYSRGEMDARFKGLESRVNEDREKNADQHRDFYDTTRCVEGIKVEVVNLGKSLDEIKIDVKEVLNRLQKGA